MADAPYTIDVVIEAPGGDTNRYAYDAEAHIFKLVEVIYTHAPLPAELGAIVGTLTEAATPLGAMVITGVVLLVTGGHKETATATWKPKAPPKALADFSMTPVAGPQSVGLVGTF